MCFTLFMQQLRIEPTPKAAVLAFYLRFVLAAHGLLSLLEFLSARYLPGVFDLFAVLVGVLAIRHREGHAPQQIMCYTVFSFVRLLVSIVLSGLFFADSTLGADASTPSWVTILAVLVNCLAPPLFACGAAISGSLWQVLREEMSAMEGSSAASSPGGGGGIFSSSPNNADSSSSSAEAGRSGYRAPLLGDSSASSSSSSASVPDSNTQFRPFSGPGHKLNS